MKIDSIPDRASMDAERKRLQPTDRVSHSTQNHFRQEALSGNASSFQSKISSEVNMEVDLTFEKDKWTPCS